MLAASFEQRHETSKNMDKSMLQSFAYVCFGTHLDDALGTFDLIGHS